MGNFFDGCNPLGASEVSTTSAGLCKRLTDIQFFGDNLDGDLLSRDADYSVSCRKF